MSAETDREALARAVAHDGPGHPYGDAAGLGDRIAALSARLAAVGFPACTCHPGDDDSERCLPRPQDWRAEIERAALSSTTLTAAPSATRDEVAEALGVVWDDGNGTGLDGWVGPGRGAREVDHEAVRARDRAVDRALRVIAAAPSATRDEVARALRRLLPLTPEPALDATATAQADALLARFNITPKEDR